MIGVGIFNKNKKVPDAKYASFNRRMFAATIDSLFAAVTVSPIIDYFFPMPSIDWQKAASHVPQGASPEEGNRAIIEFLSQSGYFAAWADNISLQFLVLAVITGIFWHFWAATPGKMFLRLKVVDVKTEKPISDSQIILRLLGYAVSTLCFCIGFFWIGIDKRKQSWHDKLADTVVIISPKSGS